MFIEYRGQTPRVSASAFVAPTAVLVGDVVVGEDSSIWFGVVVRADYGAVRIGARTANEDNCVTVGHGAVLDDCTIADGVLIGSHAVILNGANVGKHSVVAAGAPATVRRTVGSRAAEWAAHAATESLAEARAYRSDNIGDPSHHEIKSATRRKRGAVTA